MNENDKYAPTGKTMRRIADTVRFVETGGKLPDGGLKKRHRLIPHEEGVLLEDLLGTDDPNVPTTARFQIKSAHHVGNGWSNDVSPSIVTVLNRTPSSFSAQTPGFAKELATDRWYFYTTGAVGGFHKIWFTIVAVLCPETDDVDQATLVVVADEYTGGCEVVPPGANYDGTYDVTDRCGYLNGLTPADLIGGSGTAVYFYPLTGYCDPKWRIDDLCPAPECA